MDSVLTDDINARSRAVFDELYARYPHLRACEQDTSAALQLMTESFRHGGKLLLCGNGGSAADCGHIVGELMKGFCMERPLPEALSEAIGRESSSVGVDGKLLCSSLQNGLPAIALTENTALITAFSNDRAPQYAFAQQVHVLGSSGDVLFAISTSGNSENVLAACAVAKAKSMGVVALSGEGGGELASIADVCIRVPEHETFKIQELHLPVYHALCLALEATFFEG